LAHFEPSALYWAITSICVGHVVDQPGVFAIGHASLCLTYNLGTNAVTEVIPKAGIQNRDMGNLHGEADRPPLLLIGDTGRLRFISSS
jgi:hypothetical protein